MSIRIIEVTPSLVSQFLKRCNAYESDLPEDIQLVRVDWDEYCQVVRLFIQSKTFTPIEDGKMIPTIDPIFTEIK